MRKVFVVGALLMLLPVASAGQAPGVKSSDATAVVKAFYAFHFSHKFDNSPRGLQLRRRWLDANLYKLLLAELKRPTSPGDAPDLDGDPFTDSQDPPSTFRIGKSTEESAKATIEVVLVWKEKAKVFEEKKIDVDLTKTANVWKIGNIRADHPDGDLLQWLKRSR